MANKIYIYKQQIIGNFDITDLQSLIGTTIVNVGNGNGKCVSIEIDSASKTDLDDIMLKIGYVYVAEEITHLISACNLGAKLSTNPPTSIASVGCYFYATDLNKPLLFDGTNWRDAAGTIVI